MPTGRELRKLLQPLLDRRPDLAFVGRLLFFQPLTHYLRGVGFDFSRFHSASGAVSFVSQLYNGQDSPHAFLPVESIVDYVEHQQRPPYLYLSQGQALETSPIATFTVALGECSVGDYDAAEKRLAAILQPSPLDPYIEVSKYCPHVRGRMRYFLPILREDRAKVLPLLHDWEAHAVKGMKLTKYWKPTPFPGEL